MRLFLNFYKSINMICSINVNIEPQHVALITQIVNYTP